MVIVLLGILCTLAFAQDELRPWERLGLSQSEWKMIQENSMSMAMVEKLLKDGVGISEYFRKPWESVGLSEDKWLVKRRSGLSNRDIEMQFRATEVDTEQVLDTTHQLVSLKYSRNDESRERISSLFLPGYRQCLVQHKVRGRVMMSLAVGSIVGCTAWSLSSKQFNSIPIFLVLVPDMVWSFVDFSYWKRRSSSNL